MDRRKALKNISLGLGYVVATPTVMNILASCTTEKALWSAEFLSITEQHMVTQLAGIILPASEIPGALDVNVPEFIDKMYMHIESDSKKDLFQKGSEVFAAIFKETYGKKAVDGEITEFEKLFAKYFKLDENQTKEVLIKQNRAENELEKSELEDYYMYNFLISVRYYTLFGYYTSEKVGEEILSYDPIPGRYDPCIPVDDIGNAWSL